MYTSQDVDVSVDYYHHCMLFLPEGKIRPADKLQIKAATILTPVGLARSKQDPMNRGHSTQYLYRPLPGGFFCGFNQPMWLFTINERRLMTFERLSDVHLEAKDWFQEMTQNRAQATLCPF